MFIVINDQQFKPKQLREVGRAGGEESSIFNLTDWQKKINRA